MSILIGIQPNVDKLLNTEYEENPPNISSASEAHIHTHIHIMGTEKYKDRQRSKTHFSLFRGWGLKRVNLSKFRDRFFPHRNTFSHIIRI
jgi:hypothetical protein